MTAGKRAAGRLWTGAAVMTLNTLVLFAIVNLLCWAWLRATADEPLAPQWELERRSGQPLTVVHPGLSASDIAQLMEETWTRTHRYEAFTGHAERPFAGRFVNVDSNGYRLGSGPLPWPPARGSGATVFVFGGSTTFGVGVPDQQAIPAYLQEVLRNRYGSRVTVYNFGRGYYYSSQERALFSLLLERGVVPDLAIFFDGLNEFLLEEPPYADRLRRFMDGDVPRPPPLNQVPAVAVSRRLVARLRRPVAQGSEPPRAVRPEMSGDSVLARYLANQRMIAGIAAAFGTRALFVWQPVPTYKYDISRHLYSGNSPWLRNAGERTRAGYQALAARLAGSPASDGFLWLADIQENLGEPLYVDQVHYTAAMNRRLAEAIATRIIERRWLEGRGSR